MKNSTPDQIAERSLQRHWIFSAFLMRTLASLKSLVPPFFRMSHNRAREDEEVMRGPKEDVFSTMFIDYCFVGILLLVVGVILGVVGAVTQFVYPFVIFLGYAVFYFLHETIVWRFQPLEPAQIANIAKFLKANKEEYWKENLAQWIAIRPLAQRDRLALTKAWNKKEKILQKNQKETRYIQQTNELLGGEMGALVEKYRLKNETVPAPIKEAIPRRL